MGLKEAYLDRVEAQIKEWDADFEKMKAKAQIASAEARIEYYNKLEGMQARADQFKKEFSSFKESSGEAWEELKGGLDKAYNEMSSTFADFKETFTQAVGKFQKDQPGST